MTMKLVDVHAHLDHKRFGDDLDEVIGRFEEVGGKLLICSGVNSVTNRKILEFAKKYKVVRVSFGLYPVDALAKECENGEADGFLRDLSPGDDSGEPDEFDVDEELAWIEKNKDSCVAIGEIGLDYNWKEFQSEKMRAKQKEIFRKVLRLAKKIGKPVIIHSRKAELDAIEILEDEGITKAIMHCFSGKKSLIKRCVGNGWFLSVPAVITRLEHFKVLVEVVPLGQLLTETDAPYLSPIAGERNESVNVLVTLGEIAKIKGMNVEEVGEQIYRNAESLFEFKK